MFKPTAVICLSHFRGGMELDSIKCFRLLKENSSDTILICRKGTFIHDYCIENGIECYAVKFRFKLSLSLIIQLRKIFKNNIIKNVIFFGASEIKSIYFAQLFLKMNICVRYGTTKSSPKKDVFHRLFYSCVSYHIGISDHICRNVRDIIPISPDSTVVKIYTHTDFPESVTDNQRRDPGIVLLSRIAPGKGHMDVVTSCEAINTSVHFYGGVADDRFNKELEQRVADLGVTSKIIFHGHTNRVHETLRSHSIFVLPSLGEGLPNSLIEALGNGLICICYDNTVFPEFREMGFYIHLIKTGDIDSLRKTIQSVVGRVHEELLLSKPNEALTKRLFSKSQELDGLREILY